MDILKELKNFKKIEPDADYLLRSKSEILGERIPVTRFWSTLVFSNSRMAFATLGLVAILIMGTVKFAGPNNLAKLDATSLKAEAQAIGIQIELTNLNYTEIDYKENQTTPAKIVTTEKKTEAEPESNLDEDIDKALEELSE